LADPLGGSCFAVRGVTPKTLLQTRKPFNCGLHKIRVDRFLPEGGKNHFFSAVKTGLATGKNLFLPELSSK